MKFTTNAFIRRTTLLSIVAIASASVCAPQGGKLAGQRRRPSSAASQFTAPVASAVPPTSTNYAYTLINFPGAPNTEPNGMNLGATGSEQLIAGAYYTPEDGTTSSGFLLKVTTSSSGTTTETFSPVNVTDSPYQQAESINNAGTIVGFFSDPTGFNGIVNGYQLSDNVYTTLSVPFATAVDTYAYANNNAGSITGCWDTGEGFNTAGFTLIGGTYTNIGQFPGQPFSCPVGINDDNAVVGGYGYANNTENFSGFLYHKGKYTSINVPGATSTAADGINDAGDIAGSYCATSACTESVFGAGTQGFVLIGGVYSTISIPGATSTYVYRISNAGVIQGTYNDSAGISHGFIGIP